MNSVTENAESPAFSTAKKVVGNRPSPSSPDLVRSPFPAFTGKVVLGAARVQTLRWDRALTHVRDEQERALAAIVRHARATEYGKRRDFSQIHSYRDFAGRVPIGDYDTFSPYIERMRRGEKNLLVPEFVRQFNARPLEISSNH